MPARLPRRRPPTHVADVVHDELEHEIVAEKAAALGRMGRRLEASLRRLADAETSDRDAAIANVAHDAWCYLVQREVCGMREHRAVIDAFGIPREALVRMGAIGGRSAGAPRKSA
jgi:hypothetical protein